MSQIYFRSLLSEFRRTVGQFGEIQSNFSQSPIYCWTFEPGHGRHDIEAFWFNDRPSCKFRLTYNSLMCLHQGSPKDVVDLEVLTNSPFHFSLPIMPDAVADSKVESIPFLKEEIKQRIDSIHGSHLLTTRTGLTKRLPGRSIWSGESWWSHVGWWGLLVVLLLSTTALLLERYKYPQHTHDCGGDSMGYAPWCNFLSLPNHAERSRWDW